MRNCWSPYGGMGSYCTKNDEGRDMLLHEGGVAVLFCPKFGAAGK